MTPALHPVSPEVMSVLAEMTREQRIAIENLIALPLGYLQAAIDVYENCGDNDGLYDRCVRLRELLNGIAEQVSAACFETKS